MDEIKDAQVVRLVERISEHYRINISNPFIRPILLQLPLDKSTWTLIESLTEKFEQFRYQGFHLDDLYRQLAAVTKFVVATRREVAPNLRFRVGDAGGGVGHNKVLRDMAVNTFSANLQLFAEMLCELYKRLIELDVAATKNKQYPVYQQSPEFMDLDEMLLYG